MRGHSNIRIEELTQNKRTGAAMIPIEGGASVYSVKSLPTLALRREEWKQIGDRMRWDLSPANSGGGCLWVQFHDRGGRIEVENLTLLGIQEAKFQCARMTEELEEAAEKLEKSDS